LEVVRPGGRGETANLFTSPSFPPVCVSLRPQCTATSTIFINPNPTRPRSCSEASRAASAPPTPRGSALSSDPASLSLLGPSFSPSLLAWLLSVKAQFKVDPLERLPLLRDPEWVPHLPLRSPSRPVVADAQGRESRYRQPPWGDGGAFASSRGPRDHVLPPAGQVAPHRVPGQAVP
jgi:hypothetical protein